MTPILLRRSLLLLVVGAFCIGAAPIFAKLLMTDGVAPIAAGFWRMMTGSLGFLLVSSLAKKGRGLSTLTASVRGSPALAASAGLLFALDLAAWHTSFDYTSVANSTLIANLSSILVPLAGVIFLKERPHWLLYIGGLAAFGGVMLLVIFGQAPAGVVAGGSQLLGDSLALLTAFLYTGYMFVTKILASRYGAVTLMATTSAITAAVLLIFCLGADAAMMPRSAMGWLWVLALGLVSQCAGQGLIAVALKTTPLSLSALVLLVAPVSTALLGVLVLGQTLTFGQVCGIALTIAGIGLVVSRPTQP